MKRSFLLIFLLISTITFAQNTFDKAAFEAIMERYQKDPVKFLKTEASPDLVLAGSDGMPNDQAKLISLYDHLTPTARSFENVTARQYGNTGIATGITTHNYTSKTTGRPLSYRELFTYVFVSSKSGQWQFVSGQHSTAALGTRLENEAAIRNVIDTETNAYHEGKNELLRAQWSNTPYAERQQQNLTGLLGVPFAKGDKLKGFADSFLKTHKSTGNTARISDYDVHISGATAWATYSEELLDSSTKVVSTQREVKILERGSDGWKIVFLSTQGMK